MFNTRETLRWDDNDPRHDVTTLPTPRKDADLILDIEGNWDTKALRMHNYAKRLERELAQANRKLERELEHSRKRIEAYKSALAAARKDSERLAAELEELKLFKRRYEEDFKLLRGSVSEAAVIDELRSKAAMEGGER